jgi:hypothetical protein
MFVSGPEMCLVMIHLFIRGLLANSCHSVDSLSFGREPRIGNQKGGFISFPNPNIACILYPADFAVSLMVVLTLAPDSMKDPPRARLSLVFGAFVSFAKLDFM